MELESQRWRQVSWGLQLKLIALWIFLVVPVLGIACWQYGLSALYPLGLLMLSLLIDLTGRSLCLAAPTGERLPIVSSVSLQATGAIILIFCWFQADATTLSIGFFVAAVLQVLAAVQFTNFLNSLARALQLETLELKTEQLHRQILANLLRGAGLGALTTLISAVVFVAAVLTCGAGIILAVPGAAMLLPLLILSLLGIGAMYRDYASSLVGLRTAIRDLARSESAESSSV